MLLFASEVSTEQLLFAIISNVTGERQSVFSVKLGRGLIVGSRVKYR